MLPVEHPDSQDADGVVGAPGHELIAGQLECNGRLRPRPALSNDWLTTTSELVRATYGSVGAGVELLRMSDQTTARCAGSVGSAVMLPNAQLRNRLLWYVWLPNASG